MLLRNGPLNGITIEPEHGATATVVAFQTIGGRRVVVSSPFSTAKGKPPRPGVEIELASYSSAGTFAHDGGEPRAW